jgi:hypothetical protein
MLTRCASLGVQEWCYLEEVPAWIIGAGIAGANLVSALLVLCLPETSGIALGTAGVEPTRTTESSSTPSDTYKAAAATPLTAGAPTSTYGTMAAP